MKYLRGACVVLGMLLMLAMAAWAQNEVDVVKFYYKRAELPPGQPTMYVLYVDVNGEVEPLLSVGKINRDFPAEKRAEIIAGRLQKAWDSLPDREKLSGIIKVVRNVKYKVYVLAPEPAEPIPGMPETFMQLDNTDVDSFSRSDTPANLLKQIKFALVSALAAQNLVMKDPESKLLDDQKQLAKQRFTAADITRPDEAKRDYTAAIIYNPEYVEAYQSLIALTEKSHPDFAKAVKTVLETKVLKAIDVRKVGDNAYDAGADGSDPQGYDKALASYQKANALFPECATYYWVQGMVYVRKSGLAIDGKDLEDVVADALQRHLDIGDVIARAKVEAKDKALVQRAIDVMQQGRTAQEEHDIFPGAPAFGGSWYDIFTAREELLKAVVTRLNKTAQPAIVTPPAPPIK